MILMKSCVVAVYTIDAVVVMARKTGQNALG